MDFQHSRKQYEAKLRNMKSRRDAFCQTFIMGCCAPYPMNPFQRQSEDQSQTHKLHQAQPMISFNFTTKLVSNMIIISQIAGLLQGKGDKKTVLHLEGQSQKFRGGKGTIDFTPDEIAKGQTSSMYLVKGPWKLILMK